MSFSPPHICHTNFNGHNTDGNGGGGISGDGFISGGGGVGERVRMDRGEEVRHGGRNVEVGMEKEVMVDSSDHRVIEVGGVDRSGGTTGVDRFRHHVNTTSQALALPSPIKQNNTEFIPPPPVNVPTFAPPTIIAPQLSFSKQDKGTVIQVCPSIKNIKQHPLHITTPYYTGNMRHPNITRQTPFITNLTHFITRHTLLTMTYHSYDDPYFY